MKKILLLLSFLPALNSSATQYFIQCGENHGLQYFPNTLTVDIGDTVTWMGDFLEFPFKNTIIPAGAATFGADDGNSFSYVPQIAGNYYYDCTIPSFAGTKGDFTVTGSSLNFTPLVNNVATSLYVTNSNGINILHSLLADSSSTNFTISIFDMSGRMITSARVNMNNSGYMLPQFQTGIYIVRAIDDKDNLYATKVWQQ